MANKFQDDLIKTTTLKNYNNYIHYFRFQNPSIDDITHLKETKEFIYDNLEDIKNSTWYDLAGGFMSFCVEINGSTYILFNDKWDGENDVLIYHELSLKAYIELEKTGYDMDLLLQEETSINKLIKKGV